MSFRRRHRWTRRFLLSLAFGLLVATPAGAQVVDPYLTDIPSRPSVVEPAGPDGIASTTDAEPAAAARPDDRADRFTVTGGEPVASSDDGFALDRESGLTIGLGALAVALALGFAVAYARRPRIAL